MGRGCQGDLACSQGRRWSPSAYMGGKKGVEEREGNTPGGFTRVIQSRLPASKKEGKGKKKHGLARQKQEGKKGELYLPPNEPPSFLSPSCDFSLSFSSLPLCFTYILNRSHSLSLFFFAPSHHPLPICLTQTCFPGPAILRYRIHQQ